MEYKKICPTHHFRYSGNRCPLCEKDRIDNMVRKFKPKEPEPPQEPEEPVREAEEADFNVLAEKFRIGKL